MAIWEHIFDEEKDYKFIWAVLNKMFVAEPDPIYKDVDLYKQQIASLSAEKLHNDQISMNMVVALSDYYGSDYGEDYFVKKYPNLKTIYEKAIPLKEPYEVSNIKRKLFIDEFNRRGIIL